MKLSEVFAALERGEEVEWQSSLIPEYWQNLRPNDELSLQRADLCKFRIKPKPVVVKRWLNIVEHKSGEIYFSQDMADSRRYERIACAHIQFTVHNDGKVEAKVLESSK